MKPHYETLVEAAYKDLDACYLAWINSLIVVTRDVLVDRSNDALALLDVAEFITTLYEARKQEVPHV